MFLCCVKRQLVYLSLVFGHIKSLVDQVWSLIVFDPGMGFAVEGFQPVCTNIEWNEEHSSTFRSPIASAQME
jgi:hypothetical protein